jgi:hypothetical protein
VRIKIAVLMALAVAHVLFTAFGVVPGHLSIDEALYRIMLKNFSHTFGLEIWTGYQEVPSVELAHEFLRVHFGRPVSQYPYLYPVVALPFYAIAGFRGLFILNALAFVGVVGLCFAIARKLFRDLDLALNACLILILGTYAWEYSQSAWPHMTSLLFITAAFYLGVCAYVQEEVRSRYLFAAAAGLVAGFAPGIRVDAFLVLPCLVLPFLFARPWRPKELLLIVLAAVPGLAILAVTNSIKFGVLSPFSYGTGPQGHTPSVPLPFVIALGAGLAAVWVISRPVVWERLAPRKWLLGLGLIALVAVVLIVPQTRNMVSRAAFGTYALLVDLRVLDPAAMELSLSRSPTGGLIYLGALKKSLLQSMPYLVILIVPFLSPNRRRDFAPLAMSGLIPLAYLGFFGYIRDHGGLCLNLRFFLPMLPFTALLTAYAIRDLRNRWTVCPGPITWVVVAVGTVGLYVLLTQVLGTSLKDQEFALNVVPLLMAAFLLALILAGELVRVEGVDLLRRGAWLLLIAALTWSGTVAFLYDYPIHRAQRVRNQFFGDQVLAIVPADSVFFTFPFIDPFMRLTEKDRVRIVLPGQDQFKDFPKILDYYEHAGKRIFGVFPPVVWKELKDGPLVGHGIKRLATFPDAYLAEIFPKGAPPPSTGK